MKEFNGNIAVIRGAASGIGKALAERYVSKEMQAALADIDEANLTRTN